MYTCYNYCMRKSKGDGVDTCKFCGSEDALRQAAMETTETATFTKVTATYFKAEDGATVLRGSQGRNWYLYSPSQEALGVYASKKDAIAAYKAA